MNVNLTKTAESPSPGRGVRRAARTRAAILDAAEQAFRGGGSRAARMEDIAEAADVAIGSIYNHFGDKDGLYQALAGRSITLFGEYMERAYAAGSTPLEEVLACGDGYLRFHLEHPGAFRFLAFDGVEAGPPIADDEVAAGITDRMEQILAKFAEKIQAAIDAGEARPELDPHDLSRFLWGAWNGVVSLGLRNDRLALTDAEIESIVQTGRKLVLEGLVAPDARGADGDARSRLVSVRARD
jgi:AcrR family transcriptional regulator